VRLCEDKLVLLEEMAATSVGIREGKSAAVLTLRDALTALATLDQRIELVEARMVEFLDQKSRLRTGEEPRLRAGACAQPGPKPAFFAVPDDKEYYHWLILDEQH